MSWLRIERLWLLDCLVRRRTILVGMVSGIGSPDKARSRRWRRRREEVLLRGLELEGHE